MLSDRRIPTIFPPTTREKVALYALPQRFFAGPTNF
jgi:hypothetical protein